MKLIRKNITVRENIAPRENNSRDTRVENNPIWFLAHLFNFNLFGLLHLPQAHRLRLPLVINLVLVHRGPCPRCRHHRRPRPH